MTETHLAKDAAETICGRTDHPLYDPLAKFFEDLFSVVEFRILKKCENIVNASESLLQFRDALTKALEQVPIHEDGFNPQTDLVPEELSAEKLMAAIAEQIGVPQITDEGAPANLHDHIAGVYRDAVSKLTARAAAVVQGRADTLKMHAQAYMYENKHEDANRLLAQANDYQRIASEIMGLAVF